MKKTLLTMAVVIIMAVLTVNAQTPSTDQLTEVDKLRLEIINLKFKLADTAKDYGLCLADKGPLQDQVNKSYLQVESAKTIEAINAAHPGFTFDPKTGQFAKKDSTDVGDKKQQ